MQINGREIRNHTTPYVVAEISGNHAGDIKNAIGLIKAAKAAGADAVKTQCYDADSMTIDCDREDFIIKEGLWKGRKLYELYQAAATPMEWHPELYKVADAEGITIFSSVFDIRGLDVLVKIGCPAFKIASFEANDPYFRDVVRSIGKPVIISTGAISLRQANMMVQHNDKNICLLHCVSEYPTPIEDASLYRMTNLMGTSHNVPVGLSDHTEGVMIPLMATAMGAAMIEKHLRLDTVKGEDYEFSLNPDDFATMCEAVQLASKALTYRGDPKPSPFQRSLYAIKDIKQGETFCDDNIRIIRPGYGAIPHTYQQILGEEASRDYQRGEAI